MTRLSDVVASIDARGESFFTGTGAARVAAAREAGGTWPAVPPDSRQIHAGPPAAPLRFTFRTRFDTPAVAPGHDTFTPAP